MGAVAAPSTGGRGHPGPRPHQRKLIEKKPTPDCPRKERKTMTGRVVA